jgi:hypothetical protein
MHLPTPSPLHCIILAGAPDELPGFSTLTGAELSPGSLGPGGGLFSHASMMRPGQQHEGHMPDPGTALLSADLLGEIDGTSVPLGGMHALQGHMRGMMRGADPALSLPEDSASLFSPPSAPRTTLQGGSAGYGGLW